MSLTVRRSSLVMLPSDLQKQSKWKAIALVQCWVLAIALIPAQPEICKAQGTSTVEDYRALLSLFHQREYAQVVSVVERLSMQETPGLVEMQSIYLGAESYYAIGNFERAKQYLEYWLAHRSDVSAVQVQKLAPYCKLRLAQSLAQLRDQPAAIAVLRELLAEEIEPTLLASSQLQLAWMLAEQNESSAEAASLCDQCMQHAKTHSHDHLSAMLLKAIMLKKANQYEAAAELLNEVRSKCGESKPSQELRFKATIALLQIKNQTKDSSNNQALIEELKRTTPPNQKLYELSKLEVLLAKEPTAFEEPEIADLVSLGLNASDSAVRQKALLQLTRLPESKTTEPERIKWCKRLLSQPDVPLALQSEVGVRLAQSHRNIGEYREAVSTLRDLTAAMPDSDQWKEPACLLLAEASFQDEQFEVAREYYAKVLRSALAKDSAETRFLANLRLSEIAAIANDWSVADRLAGDLRASTDYFSYGAATNYLFGRIAVAKGEIDEARRLLAKAIGQSTAADDEVAARAQWLIGETFMLQSQYAAAIESYRLVLSYSDQKQWCAMAYLQAGKCHEELEQWDLAVVAYETMLAKYPETIHSEEAKNRLTAAKEYSTQRIAETAAPNAR